MLPEILREGNMLSCFILTLVCWSSVEVHGSSMPEIEWRISNTATSLHANASIVNIGQYTLFPTEEVISL